MYNFAIDTTIPIIPPISLQFPQTYLLPSVFSLNYYLLFNLFLIVILDILYETGVFPDQSRVQVCTDKAINGFYLF